MSTPVYGSNRALIAVRKKANSWGIMAMHLANRGLSSDEVRVGFSMIYGDVRVHVSSTLYRFLT